MIEQFLNKQHHKVKIYLEFKIVSLHLTQLSFALILHWWHNYFDNCPKNTYTYNLLQRTTLLLYSFSPLLFKNSNCKANTLHNYFKTCNFQTLSNLKMQSYFQTCQRAFRKEVKIEQKDRFNNNNNMYNNIDNNIIRSHHSHVDSIF